MPKKPLGYWDKVIVNQEEMSLSKASQEHPIELFKLIVNKELWVAERVYMNLLDYMRAIDHPLYYEHRKPYHQKAISKAKAKSEYELDYVVRNKLKGEQADQINLTVNGKTRSYLYVSATDKVSFNQKSVSLEKKEGSFIFTKKKT